MLRLSGTVGHSPIFTACQLCRGCSISHSRSRVLLISQAVPNLATLKGSLSSTALPQAPGHHAAAPLSALSSSERNSWAESSCTCVCVTTETRHLDRLGQLGEFEQDSNTTSGQLCVTTNTSQCWTAWPSNPFVVTVLGSLAVKSLRCKSAGQRGRQGTETRAAISCLSSCLSSFYHVLHHAFHRSHHSSPTSDRRGA